MKSEMPYLSKSNASRLEGAEMALALFHDAAVRVPAYKKFLSEHNITPSRIKTVQDFETVPAVTKDNYLRKYPLHELTWDGDIHNAEIINRSSGSTGQPFYWLSDSRQRDEVAEFYELVFKSMFQMEKKKTLVIIAYGMGSWVAGTTTLLSTMGFMKEFPCTIVTPGYNKNEVIEICRNIGKEYDQVVICAYPPLVKEIIDIGREQGLNWAKLHPKFIFGAESFSEEFRDYIVESVGSDNPLLDTMNTIGSADAMVIGHETPLSVALRRGVMKDEQLSDEILGSARMPTVAQYYPWQKHLEIVGGELHISSNGVMPLVRYNIKDSAKVFSYDEMDQLLMSRQINGLASLLPAEIKKSFNWKLPFILLYGKSTNAVKFYGAMIYPENIKAFLEIPLLVANVTGKFHMQVFEDADLNQKLKVVIELAPGIDKHKVLPVTELKKLFVQEVTKRNTEYGVVHKDIQRKALPTIQLVTHGKFSATNQDKHRYAS